MDENFLTLLGAIIGFSGAILGVIITEYLRNQNELKEFYSWLAYLLAIFQDKGEDGKTEVKKELTAQTLHYIFSKLWIRIPKKVRISEKDSELEVRDLIYQFLKGGDRLDIIKTDRRFTYLREWLDKKSNCRKFRQNNES